MKFAIIGYYILINFLTLYLSKRIFRTGLILRRETPTSKKHEPRRWRNELLLIEYIIQRKFRS